MLAEFSVLKTKTALAVGEMVGVGAVVAAVVAAVVVGAVVVSMQLNSSQGQPPRQFC